MLIGRQGGQTGGGPRVQASLHYSLPWPSLPRHRRGPAPRSSPLRSLAAICGTRVGVPSRSASHRPRWRRLRSSWGGRHHRRHLPLTASAAAAAPARGAPPWMRCSNGLITCASSVVLTAATIFASAARSGHRASRSAFWASARPSLVAGRRAAARSGRPTTAVPPYPAARWETPAAPFCASQRYGRPA